jgi:heme-degrading monooxygenase HmoA
MERHIKVDTDHFSVRFLVPTIAIGLTLLVHIVGMMLFQDVLKVNFSADCIIIPLDLIVLVLAGYSTERILKQLMPSRRDATLSDDGLVLIDGRKNPPQILHVEWDQEVAIQAWRFEVKRRTRVPKGWYCLALHLSQDEDEVIVYSFFSPEDAEKIPGFNQFTRLRPRKETITSTDLSANTSQRRLLKLEDRRWNDGAEFQPDDFKALMSVMQAQVPGWI